MENPKLRNGVEAFPVVYQGKQMILLKDRFQYTDKTLLLSPEWAYILTLMDGSNTIRDIQADYMRRTGQLIYSDDLQRFFEKLDDCMFLENDKFIAFMASRVKQFFEDPVRHPKLSGTSYPKDPVELKKFLQSLSGEEVNAPDSGTLSKSYQKVVGIILPHIDLNLGGKLYARGYSKASEYIRPQTWIILGTSHEPLENCFALTFKDFETPLGVVSTDKSICEFIKNEVSFDILDGEFNHAYEHTIEFQTVFLKFCQPEAKIVPIICSFSEEDYRNRREIIEDVIKCLSAIVESHDVGIIASVDLAHIGIRYGDSFVPSRLDVQENLSADKEICEALVSLDLNKFERLLWRDHLRRRICGAGPLFVFGRVIPKDSQGELLELSYGFVDNQNSFVTFCTALFLKE